jgi:Gpi18-like mannosyltransferase
VTGSPGSGAPARDGSAAPATLRDAVSAIAVMLALGLAFRLIMAYLIPDLAGSGFKNDLISFRAWATDLAANGFGGFYDRPGLHDYTPGYLYVLWFVGKIGAAVGGVGDLIKLPAILSDIALALVVYVMLRNDLGVRERRARLAALVVLANPVTWFDSVIWGQVDSVGVVFLLLAVRELWKGRHERAAILTVVAALIKPQLGILVPIVAFVTIRRALWPDGGYGDEPAPKPSGLAFERLGGPVRILSTGLAGFVTAVILSAPFGLSVLAPTEDWQPPFVVPGTLVQQLGETAGGYPYLTVNAHNLWALVSVDHNGGPYGLAANGGWVCDVQAPAAAEGAEPSPCGVDSGQPYAAIAGIPSVVVGATLLIAVILVVSLLVARRPDRLTILVGLAVLALAFFVVPTRVHERYLFPLVGIGAVLAAISWRWAIAYAVASTATFLNMYVVLTTIYGENPKISDWLGIGPTLREAWPIAMIALAHTAVFAWAFVQLRRGAAETLALDLEEATNERPIEDEDPALEPDLVLEGPAPRMAVTAGGIAGAGGIDDAPPPGPMPHVGRSTRPSAADRRVLRGARLLPAWESRGWDDRRSWLERLLDRIRETPIRPDRSRLLVREPRGRFDRLDLWLLVVLVVATMFLRTFRLAEPVQMHFDEVYHARTGTEFLQLWRYGISKEIYEWTHPHLAKYAMAGGIVAFAGHDVEASSALGMPVYDAVVEPRHEETFEPEVKGGDRLWVATGSELVAYDLATRHVEGRWPVAGITSVTIDRSLHQVVVGTATGELRAMDLGELDIARAAGSVEGYEPLPIATLGGPVRQLAAFDGGGRIAAVLEGGSVVVVDDVSGGIVGQGSVDGVRQLLPAGRGPAIIATPDEMVDLAAEAGALSELLGMDAADLLARLEAGGPADVVLMGAVAQELEDRVQAAIDDGTLVGVRVEDTGWMAVTGTEGVTFLTPAGDAAVVIPLEDADGLALMTGVHDGTQLWVTMHDAEGRSQLARINVTGDKVEQPTLTGERILMPGEAQRLLYDPATELLHVLGLTPDGRGTTVYVIEPHASVVFSDHKLPFAPAAVTLDTAPDYPATDRSAILALAPDGATASLDVGHYAFSWRLPGVIAGVIAAALFFLLARILFQRRSVAVIAGLLSLFDGMLFVQSRIGMNDVYVGLFIVAGYTLFAALWTGMIRHRHAFWVVLPAIGLLLGLALSAKWVAAYAIGALGILILGRSALGRLILILGMVAATTVLGWMAISVPAGSEASFVLDLGIVKIPGIGNFVFMFLMVALTLGATAVSILKPVAWSVDEIRFAIGGPGALGILIALLALATGRTGTEYTVGPIVFTPLHLAFALVVLSLAVAGGFALAARLGFGPLARPPDPDDPASLVEPPTPAPDGWLRIGWGFGLPAAWIGLCLVLLPIVVYVASYIPWGYVDHKAIVDGFPVASHTGDGIQTLSALTKRMYDYHNLLSDPHAASSPWWAWPLDLKPVWFYQGGYANGTAASIYDAGNIAIWWLGVPAMVFAGYMAYKRRSLALTLIVVGFLCQWVSWARIDRAAFQYHYYTSLPFVILALAYFIAELWHGASRRVWLVARVAAVVTLLGPVILWVAKAPLCAFVGVERVNPGSQACVGNPGNLTVTPAVAGIVVVGVVVGLVLIKLLAGLARPRPDGRSVAIRDLWPILATAVIGGIALALARGLPADGALISIPGLIPELAALAIGVPLALVALPVITARDSRRFVVGLLAAIGGWFVVLYPNISALPLPSAVVNAYQGLLPTYLYPFQFPVNTVDRSGGTSLSDPRLLVLGVAILLSVVVIGYAAWVWRIALAERAADLRDDGTGFARGEA